MNGKGIAAIICLAAWAIIGLIIGGTVWEPAILLAAPYLAICAALAVFAAVGIPLMVLISALSRSEE